MSVQLSPLPGSEPESFDIASVAEIIAESAEVERTADAVYGLWQTSAMRDVGTAWLQTLARRRGDLVHWEIAWQPFIGNIAMMSEIDLPEAA